VIPAELAEPLDRFLAAFDRVVPDRRAGVYLVGGLALADFSHRQSNVDLVIVCDPPLSAEEITGLRKDEHGLARAGRPAAVWYSGWDEIAEGPGERPSPLDTPLTRALLCEEALAYYGPDWPVVAYEEADYRSWCRQQLEAVAAEGRGWMVMRNRVADLVLQAARLAQGAVTGRVYSKTEAGHTALALVPHHFRRILTDAAGFRNGAHTSMYWGPFERKYDARELIRRLARVVQVEQG
jgi:hypothetical protein